MNTDPTEQVEIQFEEPVEGLLCLTLQGTEAVGEASRFELELTSEQPLETETVLGHWAFIELRGKHSARTVPGIVTRLSREASGSYGKRRYRYSLVVESSLAVLGLTRRSRIFQKQSLPDIIKAILVEGGMDPKCLSWCLAGVYSPQLYVVQYDETDLNFLRRLCERGGLHFYFTTGSDPEVVKEHLVVSDDSTNQKPHLAPLAVVDVGALHVEGLYARRLRVQGTLCPGKITLRDYDPENPAARPQAVAASGKAIERGLECYQAPAGFRSPADGKTLAQTWLEAGRADARRVVFESNALGLYPGGCCELESFTSADVVAVCGRTTVTSMVHEFSREFGFRTTVTVIPSATPFRLPRLTPQRRIAGIHSAWITGPEGPDEVFTDELGRVRIRFNWDREGPKDENSSLPVRVLQANTAQSMMTPRIGWEVWVGFEEGDPERPVVLGRCYNALQPPPYALPANKTVSAIRSFSSPGAGAMNSVEFKDAAGAQGLTINAASGKTTTVGGSLKTQTDKAETRVVGAAQLITVSGSENLSVKQAYQVGAGSQIATVGGSQDIGVKGKLNVRVGSETVTIGGALLEQVGSPAAIALNLAMAAAVSGATSKFAQQWLKGKGQLVASGIHLGQAAYGGGAAAVGSLGATMALGHLAAKIPGGDALVLGVKKNLAGGRFPWEPAPEAQEGPNAEAEAAVAAKSAGGGASAGGAGNKEQKVTGNVIEIVGGAHTILTPARVDWETSGGQAQLIVGGCHLTSSAGASLEVLGVSSETVGSHLVKAQGGVSRSVKALARTECGALTVNSKGNLTVKASALNLTFGALNLSGSSVTFKCGSSVVAFSDSGLLVKSGTIKITKTSNQSADTKH